SDSRTGVRETPSLLAISTSRTRSPGASSPWRIISRIRTITREFLPAIFVSVHPGWYQLHWVQAIIGRGSTTLGESENQAQRSCDQGRARTSRDRNRGS